MRKGTLLLTIIASYTLAQEAPICYVPSDVLDQVGHTLAFYGEFHFEGFSFDRTRAVTLEYTWMRNRLKFYDADYRLGFSYAPDASVSQLTADVVAFHCGPADDKDFLKCLRDLFGEREGQTGQASTPKSTTRFTAPPVRPQFAVSSSPSRPFCTVRVDVPEWRPSPPSEFKRYVIQKIKDQLNQEIPGLATRVVISDFNLNDPLVLVYAETNVPGEGAQRLFITGSLNQRRVVNPVLVIRMGASYVTPEEEESVRSVLRHGIQLLP